MTMERVQEQFVIPVLRHTDGTTLRSLARALADGGLMVLEITLNGPAALEVIREFSAHPGLVIGAGSVLDPKQVEEAIHAGAQFLVSPGLDEASVSASQKHGVPFIPGVLTPTEIMRARACGCRVVKLFPFSSLGGGEYIKKLRESFPDMAYLCTGGASIIDLPDMYAAGAFAVGLGRQLAPKAMVDNKDWAGITALARRCNDEVRRCRSDA